MSEPREDATGTWAQFYDYPNRDDCWAHPGYEDCSHLHCARCGEVDNLSVCAGCGLSQCAACWEDGCNECRIARDNARADLLKAQAAYLAAATSWLGVK